MNTEAKLFIIGEIQRNLRHTNYEIQEMTARIQYLREVRNDLKDALDIWMKRRND